MKETLKMAVSVVMPRDEREYVGLCSTYDADLCYRGDSPHHEIEWMGGAGWATLRRMSVSWVGLAFVQLAEQIAWSSGFGELCCKCLFALVIKVSGL
jgi:hypothetical protein